MTSTFPNCSKIRFFHLNCGSPAPDVQADIPIRRLDIVITTNAEVILSWIDSFHRYYDLEGWTVSVDINCFLTEKDSLLLNENGDRAGTARDCHISALLRNAQSTLIGGISCRIVSLDYSMTDEEDGDSALLLDLFTTCADQLQDLRAVVIRYTRLSGPWATSLIRKLPQAVKHLTLLPTEFDGLFQPDEIISLTRIAYNSTLNSLKIQWELGSERPASDSRLDKLVDRSTFNLTARCVNPHEHDFTHFEPPISTAVSWAKCWAGGLPRDHLRIQLPIGRWEADDCPWVETIPDILVKLEDAGLDWRTSK